MKFRVDRDQFADAVAWAGRTVPTRPALPMLSGLRLECVDGGASRRHPSPATTTRFPDGSRSLLTSPALASPLSTAACWSTSPARCQRSPLTSRSRVPGCACGAAGPPSSCPRCRSRSTRRCRPCPTRAGRCPEPGASACALSSQAAVAAGRDDALPFLTGVRVEVDGDQVTLAATDRYRLAVRTFSWSPRTPDFSAAALVPARTLADTAKALAHADEVHLAFGSAALGEGLLGIEGLDRRTTTRLLEGDFPKYRALLPSESPTVARVETAALTEAVKRVALVAERSSAVKMIFNGQELVLEAGTGDDAIGLDAIECVVTGEPMELIAFNPGYLLEGPPGDLEARDQHGLHEREQACRAHRGRELRRGRLGRLPVPVDARPPTFLACTSPISACLLPGPTGPWSSTSRPG